MMVLLIMLALILLMLVMWVPLANAGVRFSDGIGNALFFAACLILLLPIILSMIKGGKKK